MSIPRKRLFTCLAALTLGVVLARSAKADRRPVPGESWSSLFGSEEDAAWSKLIYVNGYGGKTYGGSTYATVGISPGQVIVGSGILVVGLIPPPISPWKP